MGNPRWLEPRWNHIWLVVSTFGGVERALSFLAVELALQLKTREVAESVDALMFPIQEHEVVKAIPEEGVPEWIVDQIAQSVPVDRIRDQSVDVPVPLHMKREIVDVIQPVLAERIEDRIADQIVAGASVHGRCRGSCAGGG